MKIKGENGQWIDFITIKGLDGATFTPSVDSDGNLSWTNNKGLKNPATISLRGVNAPIDITLTKGGQAADAKAVGDRLAGFESEFSTIQLIKSDVENMKEKMAESELNVAENTQKVLEATEQVLYIKTSIEETIENAVSGYATIDYVESTFVKKNEVGGIVDSSVDTVLSDRVGEVLSSNAATDADINNLFNY